MTQTNSPAPLGPVESWSPGLRTMVQIRWRTLPWNGGRSGIRANSVVPRSIEETEGLKRFADPAQKELLINAVSLRRTGKPMQRPIYRSSLAPAICTQYCPGLAFGKCQQDVGVPGAVQSERLVKLQIA